MQERVNEKTVAIAVQATRLTGRMLARIGELYLRHVREKHRDNKIARSRDAVRDFSAEGDDYYRILSIYYVGETTYRGSIAEDLIGYSHTTCLRKRKTAIKLFGALFWKNILMYWDNSIEEMYKIEQDILALRYSIWYIIGDRFICRGLVERPWSNRMGGESLRRFFLEINNA